MTGQLTLGVIGHVDHGKTALVYALTGIDTDRLKEEKERGLSIVLGFSYLDGTDGTIDLIDVPGHRDFVRTMISGATGFDGALLVVAANEGIMPQTREHVAIAELLGIERGLVVITKTDLVSQHALERIKKEVRSFLQDTFLERASITCVSVVTRDGLTKLRDALEALEPVRRRNAGSGNAHLPIDRVFIMRGFGPVVTGTLRSGPLENGMRVGLQPAGLSATIRGLQVHNRPVDRAAPGQRVAVNLRNIKHADIRRGDVLVSPGHCGPTRRVDAELRLLAGSTAPLKNAATVRILVGTIEVMARIRLLGSEVLEPGGSSFVQLRFSRDIAAEPFENFIVRSRSPVRTIGGGRILDTHAKRHRRFDTGVVEHLEVLTSGSAAAKSRLLLAKAGAAGANVSALSGRLGLDEHVVRKSLLDGSAIAITTDLFVDASACDSLAATIVAALRRYHDTHPSRQGMPTTSLRALLPGDLADAVFAHVLNTLQAQGKIERYAGTLSLAGFDPLAELTDQERRLAERLEDTYRGSGLMAPPVDRVVGKDKLKQELLDLLCDSGRLVRLRSNYRYRKYVLHARTVDEAIAEVRSHFAYPKKFTLSEVRDLLGSSRKYTVPLMEHLDATGVTLRVGNVRQLDGREQLRDWR